MLSHGNLLSNAVMLKDYWGWRSRAGRADPRAAHLSRARPVCGHSRRAAQRQQDDLAQQVRPQTRGAPTCRDATVFMGVPTLYVRLLAEPS
jgi:malonyl-CoA/methylmalonyl-CoA synthetase